MVVKVGSETVCEMITATVTPGDVGVYVCRKKHWTPLIAFETISVDYFDAEATH